MKMFATTVLAAGFLSASASGQLLFDFESGDQGWTQPDWNSVVEFGGPANVGGENVLQFGHEGGDGWFWSGTWVADNSDPAVFAADPVVQAFQSAAANPAGKTIEFDLTVQASDLETLPGDGTDYFQMHMVVQSDGGFNRELAWEAPSFPLADQTVHVALPLDSGAFAASMVPDSGFWRIVVGVNANPGRGNVSAYIDNIEIVPEPASASLLALGGLALLRRRR